MADGIDGTGTDAELAEQVLRDGSEPAIAASLLIFFSGLMVGRSLERPPASPEPREVQTPPSGKASAPEPLRQVYWF